nr:hypothetical protein [Xanthomonas axonopodis]
MTILDRPSGRGHWALATLGGVIALLGAVLLAGGVWLAALGGSWYYAPAGAAMLVAGVLLFRGRNAGAWWFAGVVAVSLLWTWWESGSDYWRWVPRLGLIVGLAFVLALLLPKLHRPVSRKVSRSLAGALTVAFVVAFALAFMPHGVTEADGALAQAAGVLGGLVNRNASGSVAAAGAQPANAPADGDWAAYGRSQAGQRYSPLQQINRDNVAHLQQAWLFHTGDLPNKRWGAGNHAAEGGRQPVPVYCTQPADCTEYRQRQAALALRSQGQGRGDSVHGSMPRRFVLRSAGGCQLCRC